ncbi:hypothetical protein HPT27_06505 [Permianibacter sp. IMCC34836]|uniref:hypothetical protein n=1 Tax=Permianibacter fluminis TaxID=2738515 RepID=UPI001553EE2F|nr:hypothetical protein [Permianibacter fluminis]NQD36670.1 hypothetical protein [Permianibacter fluminis]
MKRHDENARREFLMRAIQTGLFGMAAGSGLLLPRSAEAKGGYLLPPGRSIFDYRGDVRVDGIPATETTLIGANALVETGSNSFISFVIGSDAHLVRENTRVQFSGNRASVAVKEEGNILTDGLQLLTGKLLSVFGRREATKRYNLRTTTATIGIRGTGVYTESASDHSYVCTCYGAVDLGAINDAGSKEDIVSAHHDAPRYIAADGRTGTLITPAPMKNHTDEELMLIEALVGRAPPFASVKGYKSPRKGY